MSCYHKISRFLGGKTAILAAVGMVFCASSMAHAEWTGDPDTKYWSSVIINKVSPGQLDGHEYFCIEFFNHGSNPAANVVNTNRACAGRNPDIKDKNGASWSPSYDGFYRQAMYYYTTGKPVRIYYGENVWKYDKFIAAYSANYIRGFALCDEGGSDLAYCFGPTPAPGK